MVGLVCLCGEEREGSVMVVVAFWFDHELNGGLGYLRGGFVSYRKTGAIVDRNAHLRCSWWLK